MIFYVVKSWVNLLLIFRVWGLSQPAFLLLSKRRAEFTCWFLHHQRSSARSMAEQGKNLGRLRIVPNQAALAYPHAAELTQFYPELVVVVNH